jgi:hypothetical protein
LIAATIPGFVGRCGLHQARGKAKADGRKHAAVQSKGL